MISYFQPQIGINVRHYATIDEQGLGFSGFELADAIAQSFANLYKQLMTESAEWRGGGARKISPGIPEAEALSGAQAGPGTVPGPPLPKQTCGLVTLRSNNLGAARRGRLYVPFPGAQDNDIAARPVAAYVDRLRALRDALIIPLTIINAEGQHLLSPVIKQGIGLGIGNVVGGDVRNVWATQRRRSDFSALNIPPV